MKILSIHLENFASYEELDFEFNDEGLVLIHGATGSGKSTLCDAIPWCLFGVTAKNGKVDDVIRWGTNENVKTEGLIRFEINGKVCAITRRRGERTDIILSDPAPRRGKDMPDTQKLINQLLGMDSELYLAGAYLHEFSQTAQFFTTTAKSRREITEQLVDLSLPTILQEKIKDQTKTNNIEINTLNNNLFTLNAKVELLSDAAKEAKNSSAIWAHEQSNRISTIEMKRDTFEITRSHKVKSLQIEIDATKLHATPIYYDLEINKLQAVLPPESAPCKTCGTLKPNPKREEILDSIQELKSEKQENTFRLKHHHDLTKQLNELKDQENPYSDQLIEAKTHTNPHAHTLVRLERDLDKYLGLLETANKSKEKLKDEKLNLELLGDAIVLFRSELIRNTVKDLETRTVSHLRNYFEGEITVEFSIQDNDKLDVSIKKDGNDCSYIQLSKGQRQMLKLCFGVSVMESIQQHHALEFNQLFFDESLDGMDDTNKLRAVKMLETLATQRDTVYIVEHSEGVKAHIDNKHCVELISGISVLR